MWVVVVGSGGEVRVVVMVVMKMVVVVVMGLELDLSVVEEGRTLDTRLLLLGLNRDGLLDIWWHF